MRDLLRSIVLAAGMTVVWVAAPAAQSTSRTPPPLLIESLTGRESFDLYCASCHGYDGKGDGPIAAALAARPTDLSALARQNAGAFPRERVRAILRGDERPLPAHGSKDMPAWGPIFRGLDPSEPRVRVRLDNIVAYLETLQAPSSGANSPGAVLFRTHCATCHGQDARGNGPLAEQLRRRPADLTGYTARNGGVFPGERLRRIIDGRDVASHGDPAMPVWGDVFSRSRDDVPESVVSARIAAIVEFLRSIQARAAE